jgi:GAF domain-containing protein
MNVALYGEGTSMSVPRSDSTAAAVADPERLAALRRVALLDTPAEEAFDRLTQQAATALDVPISLMTLVDKDRQFFKSCLGLPEPWVSLRETPLSHSFCQHAVAARTTLLIDDARSIPLVRDNLAVRDFNVVAYLGVPLMTSDGQALGSLCVIDTQPRTWTDDEIAMVQSLASQAIAEIERRLNHLASAGTDGTRAWRESADHD